MLGNTNRAFSFRVKSIKIPVTDSIDLLGVNIDKNKKMFWTSIYSKVYPFNEDVGFANMCVLEGVPGERILFGAKDVGDKRLLNKGLIGSEKLVSKVGAKVMFI